MNLVDYIALILAAGYVVDCYHNGSLFAGARKSERLKDFTPLSCTYCMNGESPGWLLLFCFLPGLFLREPFATILKLPLYWFSAAYAAWIVNELREIRGNGYDRTARAEEAERVVAAGQEAGRIPAVKLDDGRDDEYLVFCADRCRQAHVEALLDVERDHGRDPYSTFTTCSLRRDQVAFDAICHECNKAIL